ncbi:hypothetical protein ROHU_003380 [Labeo rohita]|uniref:Uncharacterized protein n=1 Tax=Labeo rohita TaxID=84645 RepID=A0A498LUU2_LABRO|nr:hypothetical protein ROHU_010777 [Labeo rohita]RXN35961.1 hypothetical protein ROHU_003380 [Labeo rohita]
MMLEPSDEPRDQPSSAENGGVLEKGLSSGDPGHRYIEMVYGENVACKLCDLLAEVQYVLPSLRVVWQRGAGSQRALMA